jgi:hypothetical protein
LKEEAFWLPLFISAPHVLFFPAGKPAIPRVCCILFTRLFFSHRAAASVQTGRCVSPGVASVVFRYSRHGQKSKMSAIGDCLIATAMFPHYIAESGFSPVTIICIRGRGHGQFSERD